MSDYLEELDRLATLLQKNVLSQEEFDAEKARVLAARSDRARPYVSQLVAFLRRPVVFTTIGLAVAAAALGYWLISGIRKTEAEPSFKESSRVAASYNSKLSFELVDGPGCQFDQESESFIERVQLASKSPPSDPERLLLVGQPQRQSEVHTREDGNATISEIDVSLPWHGGTIRRVRLIDWPQGRGVVLAVQGQTEYLQWSGKETLAKKDSVSDEDTLPPVRRRAFQFNNGSETRYACFAGSTAGELQSE